MTESTESEDRTITPGVVDVKTPIYDEPESSYSPGSNFFPAVQPFEFEGESPDRDAVLDAVALLARAPNALGRPGMIHVEHVVSQAPTVFGRTAVEPIIYGEEGTDEQYGGGEAEDETEASEESAPEEESSSTTSSSSSSSSSTSSSSTTSGDKSV